jgi:hypothetical protein
MGQTENEAYHLKGEQQVKGQLNGGKVGKGKMRGKGLGQQIPTVHLDKDNSRGKRTHQHGGKKFQALFAFHMQFDPIKKKASPYHEEFHTARRRLRKMGIISLSAFFTNLYFGAPQAFPENSLSRPRNTSFCKRAANKIFDLDRPDKQS